MCAYQVAKKLVNDGLVEETREHHLGTVYELADEVREGLKKHRKPMPKDEDDEELASEEDTEAILDEIPDLDDDELDLEDEEDAEVPDEDER
jgi:DNA-binding PadR family transcriptional regulator